MYKYQKVLKLQFAPVINVGSITTRYGLFIKSVLYSIKLKKCNYKVVYRVLSQYLCK